MISHKTIKASRFKKSGSKQDLALEQTPGHSSKQLWKAESTLL